MAHVDFITPLHRASTRDYLRRVTEHDKAACAEVALRWGKDYWDGERHYGYGGYRYDGRWRPVAESIARHYALPRGARILDVGVGKGFLLYELSQVVPEARVVGLDISEYGLQHAKDEIRPRMVLGTAAQLPFADRAFDFVLSLNTLHNLYVPELWSALGEIERVARGPRYVVVESYRTEREKVNLLYWQLTCRAFHTPAEWEAIFGMTGYRGDHSFIFFE
jgi:ubiquinone/menaquinone biosynthesis C-methylase UbiE